MTCALKPARTAALGFVLAAAFTISLSAAALNSPWQVETVDPSGPGKFASMKIDKFGNVHVAYITDDGSHYPLKYAFFDHLLKRWFQATVDQGASFCSLVLDSKQHPHISYADAGGGSGAKLRYAHWDGQAWIRQAIPLNSDVVGYYTSIALDQDEHPHISFYEYRGPKGTDIAVRMRVVAWNGRYWEVRTIDGRNQSGKFNALAMDAHGHAHLIYANVNAITTGMWDAYWNGATWALRNFDGPELNNGGYVGYSVNMALDKDGKPHVTYMNYSVPAVKYAELADTGWKVETVDLLAGIGYPDRNGITVGPDGSIYLSYYDAGRGDLRLAHREGAKWIVETVDSGTAGFTSSVQVDEQNIWIAYADESGTGGFKIAHRSLAGSVPAPAQAPSKPAATPERGQTASGALHHE